MNTKPRGAALLMVIFILAAMALLATPFLVAMVLQEKASRGYLGAAQARAGAVGARNYAVTELLKSHEYREERGGESPFDTPEYDTYEEVVVPLDGRRSGSRRGGRVQVPLAGLFGEGIVNPRGMIWGLETQDEQGKLDWRSVPDYVAARLVEAVRETGSDPLNVFTRYAVRPAAWIAPQSIRHVSGNQICIDERTYFLEGSNVRISDGTRPFVARVTSNRDNVGACSVCGRVPIGVSGGGGACPGYGWIEVEQRHPLNLNTARRETLAAVFEGLRIRRGSQEISREAAYQIAQLLIDRPIRGETDFVRFLGELRGLLSDEEVAAVALNARAPTHLSLHHTEMVQQPNPNNPNQPSWTEEWHDPHGTVPFTWKTENVYTIEAAGTRNTPVGTELAGTRFREIVSVAPPERLRWVVEEQREFEAFLQSDGFSLRGHSDFTRGYPFGNKVVTYPARYWLKTQAMPFGEFPGAGGETSGAPGNPPKGVRPIPSKDRRRVSNGTGWVNHFVDEQSGAEGRQLSGAFDQPVAGTALLETNSGRTSEMRTFWTEELLRPGQRLDRFDIRSGGIEFWFKTTGGNPVFFDIADRDWENRLVCFARGGEIVLRACDATIERKAAEVRGRVSLQPDTWYHLGAYWDSTRLGGLSLFLDGRPVPPARNTGAFAHCDDQDRPIIAELSANLNPTDTTVSIATGGQFPPFGVIQVGTEAIEYNGFSGSGFTNCVRGARRTGPDPDGSPLDGSVHPSGAKATLYGYANAVENVTINFQWGGGNNQQTVDVLLDRIPAARGALTEGFGVRTTETYISKELPDLTAVPPELGGISETDTTIEVFPTGPAIPPPPLPAPNPPINAYDTSDFPSRGFLKIGAEVLFYSGKTATSFTGCQRGQLGTTAARHNFMSRIELFGFPVSGATGFATPALVQADDEWFGPCMLNNGCFTGLILGGVADRLRRGWRQTLRQAHAAGATVLPVFAVEFPVCGSEDFPLAYPDNRDLVTVVDRAGNKEERQLRVIRNKRKNPTDNTWIWPENLVGLREAVNQDYPSDKPYVRLLKFPSGELLARVPPSLTIGGSQAALGGSGSGGGRSGGGGSGGLLIDELRYYLSGNGRRISRTENRLISLAELAQAATASDDSLLLINNPGLPRDGGLVVVGDEIVAYREFNNGNPDELRRCERGFFGTTPAAHDAGDPVFLLGTIPVGFLAGPASGSSALLTLVGQPRGFAPEGYVLIENEAVGYIRARNNPMGMYELEMPVDRGGAGILRGRFGSAAAGHANEAVVIAMPFRYWDRYQAGVDDSQMVSYGASKSVIGATWKSLTAVTEGADKGHEIVVQARFDSRPAWDGSAAKTGRLYEFRGGGAGSLEVIADLIEIRVLFGYKPGAFFPNHSWKRAPTLLKLAVDYEQPTKTLYHEER